MARNKRKNRQDDLGPSAPIQAKSSGLITPPVDNDGAYRYSSWIRNGKVSMEAFTKSHDRRRELGLPIPTVEG